MTITREQLEKAAKQAGIEESIIQYAPYPQQIWSRREGRYVSSWNPLHDRGQLLDLAMACKICIDPQINLISYCVTHFPVRLHRNVNCQDFPALAEAVILAACEQFDAKDSP